MQRVKLLFLALLNLTLVACSSGGGNTQGEGQTATSSPSNNEAITDTSNAQWNISILLDLSDRIDPNINRYYPTPAERDLALVSKLVTLFKAKMAKQGVFKSKGRIRVIFSPTPNDARVNQLAESLRISLEGLDNKAKKAIYDGIDTTYHNTLKAIYDLSIEQKKWVGSDIWRFFKDDVRNYCVVPGYRNVLLLLTDGYLYYKDSRYQEGNRYSYLLAQQLQGLGLRTAKGLDKADELDFGLISKRQDLQDLEVLAMELSPNEGHLQDYDMMRYVLEKWFKEMGVKHYATYKTDLPSNTEGLLEAFFKD